MFHFPGYQRFGYVLILAALLWLSVGPLPAPVQAAAADWTLTGSLATARSHHTATLLRSGKVLVVGGEGLSGSAEVALASAELYDPVTGVWSPAGNLAEARTGHTATLLADGKVLVAGGADSSQAPLASAELYDPQTSAWTVTGSMHEARSGHTATLLGNGRVLAAGGASVGSLNTAELYDPGKGTWTVTGSLADARTGHAAVLLDGGKVLVAGGFTNGPTPLSHYLYSAELYDPSAGLWSATDNLHTTGANPTLSLLYTGQVLAAGGVWIMGSRMHVNLYNPLSGIWDSAADMAEARSGHTATRLRTGQVLAAGGYSQTAVTASAELYSPATGEWTPASKMSTPRYYATATLLRDGRILVVGGSVSIGGAGLASAEIYDQHLLALFIPIIGR